MIAWRERVTRSFDGAAAGYDAHAGAQREVARWLAERIAASGPYAHVLEIGCGTGFLTEAALAGSGTAHWLASDIAPAMLAGARQRLAGMPAVGFALIDGERPGPPAGAGFDLVCSSLAAQWFADLPRALDRLAALVRPGGALMLTTLAAGTFAEWRAACSEQAGTPDFPTVDTLAALQPGGLDPAIEVRRFTRAYPDAAAFVRSIRGLGAGTPREDHRPLSPAAFRRAAQAFEAGGAVATYEVALLIVRRPAS